MGAAIARIRRRRLRVLLDDEFLTAAIAIVVGESLALLLGADVPVAAARHLELVGGLRAERGGPTPGAAPAAALLVGGSVDIACLERLDPLGIAEQRLDARDADRDRGHERLPRGPGRRGRQLRDVAQRVVGPEDRRGHDEDAGAEERDEEQLAPEGEVDLHDDGNRGADDAEIGARSSR